MEAPRALRYVNSWPESWFEMAGVGAAPRRALLWDKNSDNAPLQSVDTRVVSSVSTQRVRNGDQV